MPLAALIEPSQHPALARRLAAADEQWRPAVFAFLSAPGRPSVDRRLWLARPADEVLVIGEPVTDEQERLVEKVLELNDELVATHRELVRQRSAAEAAAERVRHLEAISAAGLTGTDLGAVLHDVLEVIAHAVDADSAAILLRDGEAIVVRAAVGAWREHAQDGVAGVPLTLDGRVHGALQVRARAGSEFTDADLRLLTPAAERAALAISRAQLLERERGIAETLQRALLPERLPDVPGLRLSALFEPATGAVGGDWYDALALDGGEVALLIGDVAGKGIPAAALMGELRGGLRAGVLDGGEPNEMLRRLDRLAVRAGRMATVLLVLLDPRTGALRHASAGHLPPLLIEPDGAVRFLRAGAAPPLLAFDPAVAPGTTTLAPGARLLLYTDGLVERRREPIDQSLARLAAAAAGFTGDLAELVAAMVPPGGRPARRHRDPFGAAHTLTRRLAILAASQLAAVVKLVYTQASGACGLYARGGSSPLSRTLGARCYSGRRGSLPLSSRGLGRRPLTAETGVRIPVAVSLKPACLAGFVLVGGESCCCF